MFRVGKAFCFGSANEDGFGGQEVVSGSIFKVMTVQGSRCGQELGKGVSATVETR
jgi:hypothetical protein